MKGVLSRSGLLCLLAIAGMCAYRPPHCDAGTASNYICHRASNEIRVDGVANDPDWQKAGTLKLVIPVSNNAPISKTEAKLLWNDTYLYVSFRGYDKDVWSLYTKRDSATFQEDCFECFLKTDPKSKSYYNFEINAVGTVYDAYGLGRLSGGYDRHRWSAWDCEGLQVGISVDGTLNNKDDIDRSWSMEIAIPLASMPSLNGKAPSPGQVWLFLLARYEYSVYLPKEVEPSSCAYLKAEDFHDSSQWLRMKFAK